TEMRRDRKEIAARYNEVSTQLTTAQTELKNEKRRNSELQQKLEKLIAELSDAQEKIERYGRKNAGADQGTSLADLERRNAVLREEMAVLAARVVAATAEKEGPDSPIHSILEAEKVDAGKGTKAGSKSLARRIRDLQ